jgi:hypothetical protein
VLSELALRLSGAAIDDPVIAAVGLRTTDPDTGSAPVGPAEEAELGALAERVQAWLRERLGLHPDEELDWLWRRRVSIVAEPGWIEAEFSLDDVDIRIRAAGLDLDPGFVWWLGAVVSYRYV